MSAVFVYDINEFSFDDDRNNNFIGAVISTTNVRSEYDRVVALIFFEIICTARRRSCFLKIEYVTDSFM